MTTLAIGRRWMQHPAAYTLSVPLLTVAGAGTTIVAPMLLSPAEFGQFVLLSTIFQYVADFDLGLSRLTDRIIPTGGEKVANDLLWTRVMVGTAVWVCLMLLSLGFLQSWPMAITITAGTLFMLRNGPVAIYRASRKIGDFTVAALSMQFGMSLPRLMGLLAGGVTGSFAALLLWYSMTASGFYSVFKAQRPALRQMTVLVIHSLPLFAFATCWTLYLLSNRWIAALLTNPYDNGLFGLGASLLAISVSTIGTVAQVHYPKHLVATDTMRLMREALGLLLITFLGVLVGIPLCHQFLPIIFPSFATASSTVAMIIIISLPLNLCAWLVPLVIAKAQSPWKEASTILGSSTIVLGLGMIMGHALGGLAGLSVGCLPSACLLLGLLCRRLAAAGLLSPRQAMLLIAGTGIAVSVTIGEWLLM